MRILPATDADSEFFWTSGRDGRLRVLRCAACSYWIHPPAPYCPRCDTTDVAPECVAGTATVHSFTVNRQQWDADPVPYVIAIVELDEQPGLRLTTNLVDVDPDAVEIDQRVAVTFEDHDPLFIPVFRPLDGEASNR